ncbi:hypothetical protein BH11MYX3_BH11MYX3_36260 [soil metagenome]
MMMHRVLTLASGLILFSACAIDDKSEPTKGEVDESEPPSEPTVANAGPKADDVRKLVSYDKQSAHPYANNLNQTISMDLATVLPSCATQVKVHFPMLRTEAGYDYLSVRNGSNAEVERYDGNRDNTWTGWIPLSTTKSMSLKLTSDSSVVRDGFTVDQLEWDGYVTCPAPPDFDCAANSIDLRRPAPACGCREISHCTPLTTVTIAHTIGGGFTGQITGKKAVGTTLSTTVFTPAAGETSTAVGSVDQTALHDYLDSLVASGVLYGPGRAESANWTECLSITTDQETVSYCAAAGSHTPAVVDAITRFEALGTCGGSGSLTCGSGRACNASGECATGGCICPANYNPVCSVNGTTYSNACAAGCASAEVKHTGECGAAGDSCGTIRGLTCLGENKCRYGTSAFTAPFPDAGGACVAPTYCDAPTDCAGLIHPAVIGYWTCAANSCAYQAGIQWTDAQSFESAHPYAPNVSQWQQVYLPEGATKMRLTTVGTFDLETNYDFLEVWSWVNNAWVRTKRFTGTVGPTWGDEFAGRYFYLKFVTDTSVQRAGFKVTAQYR